MTLAKHLPTYCLFCYEELERPRVASVHCPACGRLNLRQDLQDYWTREPRFVRLERALKLVIVALVALASGYLMFPTRQMHGYAGVGYSAGAPLLIGIILWDTASLATRRRSMLRLELLWPALVFLVGAAPVLFFVSLLLMIRPAQVVRDFDSARAAWVLLWVCAWALLGLGMRWAVARLAARRRAYLERRLGLAG